MILAILTTGDPITPMIEGGLPLLSAALGPADNPVPQSEQYGDVERVAGAIYLRFTTVPVYKFLSLSPCVWWKQSISINMAL